MSAERQQCADTSSCHSETFLFDGKESPPTPSSPKSDGSPSPSRKYLPPSMLEFFSPSKDKRRGAKERTEKTEATIIDLSSTRMQSPRGGSNAGSTTGNTASQSPKNNSMAERGGRAVDEMKEIIGTVNFMNQYVSPVAKVFCVLVLASSLITISTGIAVLVVTYTDSRRLDINDKSPCHGFTYEDIRTNSVGYNIANIFLTSFFMSWMAARSVRLEKEGLLFCFAVVSLTHIARVMYFSFKVSIESVYSDSMRLSMQILNTLSVVILVVAIGLSAKVYLGFGWRMYSKGVTAVQDVQEMRRYKQFDAVLKLDIFVCMISFISIFFLVSENTARIIGFVIAVVTLASEMSLTTFIKRSTAWAIYLFFALCIMMPTFYAYIVVDLLTMDSQHCQSTELHSCLEEKNITALQDISTYSVLNTTNATNTPLGPVGNSTNATVLIVDAALGWHWVLQGCYSTNEQTCLDFMEKTIDTCCNEYGRCQRKELFRQHDKWMMVLIATIGFTLRIATVLLGGRQMKAMNMPSVRQVFKRGERNLRAMKFSHFINGKGGADDHNTGALIDPDDLHEAMGPVKTT